MKNENWPSFLATRHSIKPKAGIDPESLDYKGISENGVELAKERADDILDILKKEPVGSILFFLGSSESERTKSTEQVYINAIKESLSDENKDGISLISKSEINNPDFGYTENANVLASRINDNPEKKFIVDVNLFIKELSNSHWTEENGDFTKYAKKLLLDNNNNEDLCFRDWIKNNGISGDLIGPNPKTVAEKSLAGIKRLSEFAKKFLKDKDRNIIIGAVGHSWNLDVLAIYLANNGVVDIAGFDKIKGSIIDETQILRLKKQENNEYGLFYNDKEYSIE
ncbi:MAG: hypothetical protein WAW11_01720 [Patescibacteria group bacterium]